MDDQIISPRPHIIVFPSPLQGPINPIFDLAELLCLSGLNVTFLLIPYTHNLLLRHINIESRLNPYPNFDIHTISDGLPLDYSRSNPTDFLQSLETLTKPHFRDLLTSGNLTERGPVSCIISDGIMNFVFDVANEIQVPVISALTISPSCLWFLSSLPTGATEVSDTAIGENNAISLDKRIPGIESGDLASMCISQDLIHPFSEHLMKQIKELPRAHGLILNTFKALDGPVLSQIRSICPNLYAIGPIYKHLGFRQESKRMTPLLNYSIEKNNDYIMWLNSQQPKSVLYINIENHKQLTRVQTLELWYGLVNSEKGFVWVRRPESIPGEGRGRIPAKLNKGTKEKGFIVDSASNIQVLAHKAIGGCLTDGDWDSTIEAIAEGVPMIYWPSYWDQRVNSKFICKTLKLGIYLEEGSDRNVIEKTIRDAMGSKGELIENANKMTKLARKSVSISGSSNAMLDQLVNNIISMNLR